MLLWHINAASIILDPRKEWEASILTFDVVRLCFDSHNIPRKMGEFSDHTSYRSVSMESNFDEVQEVPSCSDYIDDSSSGYTYDQPKRQCRRENVRCRYPATEKKLAIPEAGTKVSTRSVRRAGPYLLGSTLGNSPVDSIVQCLARKEGTDNFYAIKILTLLEGEKSEEREQDERQGKMLLHTEYSLLSLLQNEEGVVQHHDFFKDIALEEQVDRTKGLVYTGIVHQRLCLVLDCLAAHDFCERSQELVNLQHYVINEKKLYELHALIIFYNVVHVVERLHAMNVVHRDLKLGNLVLDRRNYKVTITNFCLGKHLASENERLQDQRGSPAYISPDVLCGKPYLGKPSDMWALGVVLFTMLFGQFPFYDWSPPQLFNKIRAANYTIPSDGRVSDATKELIQRLIVLEPGLRLTASQVLDTLTSIIATSRPIHRGEGLQVVPDCDNEDNEKDEKGSCKNTVNSVPLSTDAVAGVCKNTIRQLHNLQSQMNEIQQRAEEALAMLEPNHNRQMIPFSHSISGSSNTNVRLRSASDGVSSTQAGNMNGRNTTNGSSSSSSRTSWRNLQSRSSNRIPVHRLANDARELTVEEVARFHNLIPTPRPSVRSVSETNISSATSNLSASSQSARNPLLNSALDTVVNNPPLGSPAPASSIVQRLNALDNARPPSHQAVPQVAATHRLQNLLRNSARSPACLRLGSLHLLSNLPSSSSHSQARLQNHGQHDRSQQRNRQQRSVPSDSGSSNQSRQRVVPSEGQSGQGTPRGSIPCQLSPRVQRTIAHNLSRNLSMIIRNRMSQQRSINMEGSQNIRGAPRNDTEPNGNTTS